jgi:CheY-like chemotaxis protein
MAKILLVEDDNNLREIYEARLQAEGYQIVSANDGETALVVAKNEKPDLVISDVMMPKISGFEMLDILRNTDGLKDVKVIMLTALGQADDQARANQLGADRYLVKSQVTLEDIVKVSHELLDGDAAPASVEATAAAGVSVTTDAAAEQPSPEPETANIPVATPPADDTASPPAADAPATDAPVDDTQSSAQEENDVAKQIEVFVANQPAEAPSAVEPSATPEAPETPEVTTPETPPEESAASLTDAAPAASTDAATQAADDKVLDDAVETLVAGAEPAADASASQEPSAEAAPAPAPTEGANEEPAADSTAVPVAHKKVIKPLDSTPKPDLDALLAAEEAREQAAAPPAMPEPIVGGAGDDEEKPSGSPTPTPSSQSQTPGPDKPFDPNSIAL